MLTVSILAPAVWLDDALQSRTPLRLLHAQGTLWHGTAFLAVSDGRRVHLLPGRLEWRLRFSEIFVGRLTLTLEHEAADDPLRISFRRRAVDIQGGSVHLPAALLAAVGAPFNTVKPGGRLHARWDNLRFEPERFEGNVQLDWEEAQSALSSVAPLGNFRLTASGRGGLGEATLVTVSGPLLLEGKGRMDRRSITFKGSADAEPEMRASLDGLIGLLGQRSGGRVLLDWEIRI
jgi:general secretion pathway protein N